MSEAGPLAMYRSCRLVIGMAGMSERRSPDRLLQVECGCRPDFASPVRTGSLDPFHHSLRSSKADLEVGAPFRPEAERYIVAAAAFAWRGCRSAGLQTGFCRWSASAGPISLRRFGPVPSIRSITVCVRRKPTTCRRSVSAGGRTLHRQHRVGGGIMGLCRSAGLQTGFCRWSAGAGPISLRRFGPVPSIRSITVCVRLKPTTCRRSVSAGGRMLHRRGCRICMAGMSERRPPDRLLQVECGCRPDFASPVRTGSLDSFHYSLRSSKADNMSALRIGQRPNATSPTKSKPIRPNQTTFVVTGGREDSGCWFLDA